MTEEAATPGCPSLLDAKSVGGLVAWSGFSAQVRYVLSSFPRWLGEATCTGFQLERGEDVDVFFVDGERRVIDQHQVKASTQTASTIMALVRGFRDRNAVLLERGQARSFVIASPSPNADVRGAFSALDRFREARFLGPDDPLRLTTLADVRRRLVDSGIVESEDFEFTVNHVMLWHDWGGLEPAVDAWARIACEIGRLERFRGNSIEELSAAAKAFGDAVQQRMRHYWSRDEVLALLSDAISNLRAGPATASGDVVFLCHQSLAPARTHPDRACLPPALADARVIRSTVDQTRLSEPGGWAALSEEIASIFDPAGPFHRARMKGRASSVVYYGFPHVPLAALAGYLFGDQAQVHLVDHDRDQQRFAWADESQDEPPLLVRRSDKSARGCAVVRVSISAVVTPELCVPCVDDPIGMEFDFGIEEPRRGAVLSQAQAREYRKRIRQTLDRFIGGNPSVSSLHVFAAVPVSVAFLIGQAAASTGYPLTFVYNYRQSDVPPYHWALCLQRAEVGSGLVLPVRSCLPASMRGSATE